MVNKIIKLLIQFIKLALIETLQAIKENDCGFFSGLN